MPEGPDYERLEPSTWKQEDARGPHVPLHCDCGGAPRQCHRFHTRLLPQPVSHHLSFFTFVLIYRSPDLINLKLLTFHLVTTINFLVTFLKSFPSVMFVAVHGFSQVVDFSVYRFFGSHVNVTVVMCVFQIHNLQL